MLHKKKKTKKKIGIGNALKGPSAANETFCVQQAKGPGAVNETLCVQQANSLALLYSRYHKRNSNKLQEPFLLPQFNLRANAE